MAVGIADGSTITFGTSSFSANWEEITPSELTRESVPTSHLGTSTAKSFVPGDTYDAGEITGVIQYNPDEQPPIAGAVETITITYPLQSGQSVAANEAASGFVTNFGREALTLDGLMKATCTIKLTGAITFTDAV